MKRLTTVLLILTVFVDAVSAWTIDWSDSASRQATMDRLHAIIKVEHRMENMEKLVIALECEGVRIEPWPKEWLPTNNPRIVLWSGNPKEYELTLRFFKDLIEIQQKQLNTLMEVSP